jgi:hypothetical protein
MLRYLEFLRLTVDQKYGLEEKKRVLLVLDMYAAHRNEDLLKDAAQRLCIDLVFVPPGMTGELQPLVATIFDALKSAGQATWILSYIDNPAQHFDRIIASENAQTCWKNLTKGQIEQTCEKVENNAKSLIVDPRLAKVGVEEDKQDASKEESSEFIPDQE